MNVDEVLANAGVSRNAPYAPTPDNRPRPVFGALLALMEETRSQMSFGERTALEGVLAQLRPKAALEIGSAEGGNLRRIAVHSGRMHSIDPNHGPLGTDIPSNEPNAALQRWRAEATAVGANG